MTNINSFIGAYFVAERMALSFDLISSCCVCKLNVDHLKGNKRHKNLMVVLM